MKSKVELPLPNAVRQLLERLEADGHEAYVVGGCVRDCLMGSPPHDWDITTSALPEDIKACFAGEPVLETGLKHGTVTVMQKTGPEGGRQPYEITTYRVEAAYSDHRRPDAVRFTRCLEDDLSRRDFTINAMAYHPARGLVDLFGGLRHLRSGVICCVGAPSLRFEEDALRILRAMRFAATLGFTLEPETRLAMVKTRSLLAYVSAERIGVELAKMLLGRHFSQTALDCAPVLFALFPAFEQCDGKPQKNPYHCYSVWEHSIRAVGYGVPSLPVRLALLFHDIAKPLCELIDEAGVARYPGHGAKSAALARELLVGLRYEKRLIERVVTLITWHDCPVPQTGRGMNRWLQRFGREGVCQLLDVKRADGQAKAPEHIRAGEKSIETAQQLLERALERESCYSLKQLAVNGADLVALGIPPGKELGRLLHLLLELVIEERLPNQKERLLQHARTILAEEENATGPA